MTSAVACGAANPEAVGHVAMTTDSPPVNAVQSVSVTNGIIGCRSRSSVSSTSPSTRLVAAASGPASDSFANSMYQSHTSSHAK